MPTNSWKTCTCNKWTQTIIIIQIPQDSPLLLLNKSSKENAKVDCLLIKVFYGGY